MRTLTVTEARKNLSGWIRRAKAGEEIGIIDGNQIVALRPVTVTATDYMESEYDLTSAEAEKICATLQSDSLKAEKAGSYVSLDKLIHASSSRKGRKTGRR
jgi:antitoxin (DNA-binding transcriptional repressor) of toxin-antitoxin stability system